MGDFITDGLVTDPDEILAGMITDFQARMPGWVPSEGSPEVVLMSIIALRHAVGIDVASQVLTAVFRFYGESIAGVTPIDATYATVDATVTVINNHGYTIPDGTRVQIATTGDPGVTFKVDGDTVILAAHTTGVINLRAEDAGAAGSGLTGTVSLIDPLDYVVSITLNTTTSGGIDGETDQAFLDRLTRRLRRLSPKIITPADAEEAVLDEIAGVGRCLVLDNFVPPSATDVPGAFTVAVSAPDGSNVSAGVKAAVLALLQDNRILDLAVYVIDPTRTNVTVTYSAVTFPGWDPVIVKAAADAAVTTYLSPAQWGSSDTSGGLPVWIEDTTVRFGELYAVLNSVQGLNHVTAVRINSLLDTDVAISGPAALPNLTAVIGTVVAP